MDYWPCWLGNPAASTNGITLNRGVKRRPGEQRGPGCRGALLVFSARGFRIIAQLLGLLDHLFFPVGDHRRRDTGLSRRRPPTPEGLRLDLSVDLAGHPGGDAADFRQTEQGSELGGYLCAAEPMQRNQDIVEPSRYILLLCIREDEANGGTSLLAHIREVMKCLSARSLRILQKPIFPHPVGPKSILTPCTPIKVRYNGADIRQYYGEREIPSYVNDALR